MPENASTPAHRLAALAATALLLSACARPDTPQVQGPLAIDIPELCTRCVEVLRCEGDQRRMIYVMDEKSTWAQIATIWDYFARFFRPKTEDYRDLSVYSLAPGASLPASRISGQQARLDVWRRRVELPDGTVIDQKTANWIGADGSSQGRCEILPPAQTRKFARQLAEAVVDVH
jgi:hypothetical protein